MTEVTVVLYNVIITKETLNDVLGTVTGIHLINKNVHYNYCFCINKMFVELFFKIRLLS